MKPIARHLSVLSLALAAGGCALGCGSGSVTSPQPDGSAGGEQASGGSAAATGGAATGGSNATTGGSSGAGGASTGGVPATGGSGATPGSPETGGATASGGASATGGNSTTGGAPATGGTTATGGSSTTGGAPATGGTTATGGSSTTGGAPATGGTTATGGAQNDGGGLADGGDAGGAPSICQEPLKPPDTATCLNCEVLQCTPDADPAELVTCDSLSNSTAREQCRAILDCARSTNCLATASTDCFCGVGVDIPTCLNDSSAPGSATEVATGACKNEIRAGFAAGTKNSAIIPALADSHVPAGVAMNLYSCDVNYCGDPTGGGSNECWPYCR